MKASAFKSLVMEILASGDPRMNILVKGQPGCGKSDIFTQVAKELRMQLILVHGVTSDPVDAKGLPCKVVDPNTMEERAEFLPYGDLRLIIEADKPTLVVLDDIGQAPQAVQAAWMQPLQARAINDRRIPDCVHFAAATNRRKDRAGVGNIITPLVNRFPVNVELEPDVRDWADYTLKDESVDPVIIPFARFVDSQGDPVFTFDAKAELENSCTPRSLTNLGRLTKILKGRVTREVAKGAVGEAVATKFVAFLQTYKELPDPDEVLRTPADALIPSRPDILYTLVGALAQRVDKRRVKNLVEYASRLPKEFSVLLLRDVYHIHRDRDNGITTTPEFSNWLMENQDVII